MDRSSPSRRHFRNYYASARRVFARDAHICRTCGEPVRTDLRQGHPSKASLEHVVPFKDGGTDDDSNLVTLCYACQCVSTADHCGKTSRFEDSETLAWRKHVAS